MILRENVPYYHLKIPTYSRTWATSGGLAISRTGEITSLVRQSNDSGKFVGSMEELPIIGER
jgi:hypothetical protein